MLKRSIFISSFSLLLRKLWLCSCLSPSSLYQFMATTLPKIFPKNTVMLGNIIPKTLKQMTSNYHQDQGWNWNFKNRGSHDNNKYKKKMNKFKSVIQEICRIFFWGGGGAKGRNHVSFF